MEKSGQNITFKYNAQGIRTEKTVNGITTQYHLVGDKVTYETDGTDTIYYTHDSAGNLVSMNFNGIEYYYVYNAQNDIIALIDAAGNEVVSYTYDTWGKLLSIEGTLKDTIGIKNPYRYRSYRYDTETGLYYLQSRYYNPEVGRMLNADALGGEVGKLLSHNVFTYARNNPINMEDPEGNIAWWIIGAGVGAVVGGISGAIYSYRTKGSVDWRYVAGGAVAGGLIGAGFGYAAQAAFSAIAAATTTFTPAVVKTAEIINNSVSKARQTASNVMNIEKGFNFADTAAKHMDNPARQVSVQILREAIKSGIPMADPRGSDAIMYYTTMYNLEVLYHKTTNTIYHFEYARKSMGPLVEIFKK